jgi:hypothetical protein
MTGAASPLTVTAATKGEDVYVHRERDQRTRCGTRIGRDDAGDRGIARGTTGVSVPKIANGQIRVSTCCSAPRKSETVSVRAAQAAVGNGLTDSLWVSKTALLRWTQMGHDEGCPRGRSCVRNEQDAEFRAAHIGHLTYGSVPDDGAKAQCNSALQQHQIGRGIARTWRPRLRSADGIVTRTLPASTVPLALQPHRTTRVCDTRIESNGIWSSE